jgi:hypothetical protein
MPINAKIITACLIFASNAQFSDSNAKIPVLTYCVGLFDRFQGKNHPDNLSIGIIRPNSALPVRVPE